MESSVSPYLSRTSCSILEVLNGQLARIQVLAERVDLSGQEGNRVGIRYQFLIDRRLLRGIGLRQIFLRSLRQRRLELRILCEEVILHDRETPCAQPSNWVTAAVPCRIASALSIRFASLTDQAFWIADRTAPTAPP